MISSTDSFLQASLCKNWDKLWKAQKRRCKRKTVFCTSPEGLIFGKVFTPRLSSQLGGLKDKMFSAQFL